MGFLAKNATKKRVAPAGGPLNPSLSGAPWTLTGAIPAAALVRSAVFSLAIGGLRSPIGSVVNAFTPTMQPHLWLETADFKNWQVILGTMSPSKGVSADWIVKLGLNTQARTASVVTAQYRTIDGALQHPEKHDEIRAELLRTLSLGAQSDAKAEERISSLSLREEQPFEQRPPAAFEVRFTLSTTLDEPTVRERLRLLGHRVRETGAQSLRWGLGLPSNDKADEVTITFGDGMLHGHGRVSGTSGTARRIAAADLRSFIARALFLIKGADPQATLQGPDGWAR